MKVSGVILDGSVATMKDGSQRYIVQVLGKEVNFGTGKSSLIDVELKNRKTFEEALSKKSLADIEVGFNIYKDKLNFIQL